MSAPGHIMTSTCTISRQQHHFFYSRVRDLNAYHNHFHLVMSEGGGAKIRKVCDYGLNHDFVKENFITRVNVLVSREKIQQNTCPPNTISNAKITGVMQSKFMLTNYIQWAKKILF